MKLYDVEGYDHPLLLSPEHAELIGVTEHQQAEASDRPARNASLAHWQEYAVAKGAAPDWADTATRTEIIEQYGS